MEFHHAMWALYRRATPASWHSWRICQYIRQLKLFVSPPELKADTHRWLAPAYWWSAAGFVVNPSLPCRAGISTKIKRPSQLSCCDWLTKLGQSSPIRVQFVAPIDSGGWVKQKTADEKRHLEDWSSFLNIQILMTVSRELLTSDASDAVDTR